MANLNLQINAIGTNVSARTTSNAVVVTIDNTEVERALADLRTLTVLPRTITYSDAQITNGVIAAVNGDAIIADTTDGSFTIRLPSNGGTLRLRDVAGTWALNPLTINGNGRSIDGQMSQSTAGVAGFEIELTASATSWRYQLNYIYGE